MGMRRILEQPAQQQRESTTVLGWTAPYPRNTLFTTRAHAPGTLANGLAVEQMDLQEAMLLLLRRARVLQPGDALEQASAADRASAEAIAREMDGLPLALDQAGAYIEETQCNLISYLNQDPPRPAVLLNRRC